MCQQVRKEGAQVKDTPKFAPPPEKTSHWNYLQFFFLINYLAKKKKCRYDTGTKDPDPPGKRCQRLQTRSRLPSNRKLAVLLSPKYRLHSMNLETPPLVPSFRLLCLHSGVLFIFHPSNLPPGEKTKKKIQRLSPTIPVPVPITFIYIRLHGSSSIFFHSSHGSNFFPWSYQRQFHLLFLSLFSSFLL